MDTLNTIIEQTKWYCNTAPDVAKFEGSPARRIMQRLDNGEVLSGIIEFTDKYTGDIKVTFEPAKNKWTFNYSWSSYTQSETLHGEWESYEWRKSVEIREKANAEREAAAKPVDRIAQMIELGGSDYS